MVPRSATGRSSNSDDARSGLLLSAMTASYHHRLRGERFVERDAAPVHAHASREPLRGAEHRLRRVLQSEELVRQHRIEQDVVQRLIHRPCNRGVRCAEVVVDVAEVRAVGEAGLVGLGRVDARHGAVLGHREVCVVGIAPALGLNFADDRPAGAGIVVLGLRMSAARRVTTIEYSEIENADDPPWPNTPMRYGLSALSVRPSDSSVLCIIAGTWPMPWSRIVTANCFGLLVVIERDREVLADLVDQRALFLALVVVEPLD